MKETKHTGRTVAVVGGAGLLAWLLLRRGGEGKGHVPGDGATPGLVIPGSRCVVWIRGADRIEVDGVAVDLATAIARCRAVESAEVHASGDARQGFVTSVVKALSAAGIKMIAAHDLATILPAKAIDWSPRPLVAAAPRNGTMSAYRPVGERGERYPEWVQRLRGASGVYVIREIGGPIVYVGSSVRRLYATLTRHFQTWRRWKGYWREHQFAEGADPGLTYERNNVEVAIKLTTPDEAHEEEMRMIRRLQPRDNQLGQPAELEEAPF